MIRILAIEDNDQKWERVERLLRAELSDVSIERATDLYDGERLVEERRWDLLILDVSLDIRTSAKGARGTHDYQAGLKIARRMFYQECEIKTIIVTGFDSFPTGGRTSEKQVILGLEEVDANVRKLLGAHLLATVRYNGEKWDEQLAKALRDGGFK